MDIPGLSIFQGGGSIQLNSSANEIEEQEALEDQKRRNEELGNELQNAFDDLIDDDDHTLDTHYNQEEIAGINIYDKTEKDNYDKQKFIVGNKEHLYGETKITNNVEEYLQENEHLKKVVQSKNNELENISTILQEERKKFEDLKKHLAIAEAEKCRAQMTKQQTHELLVESKAKYSELEDSTSKLKMKMKNLEDTNIKLEEDLERTRLLFSEVQQKYHMVEKNAGLDADRRADILMKKSNDRRNAQVDVLQQQIDNLRNKLDDKDRELNTLDARYKELQKNREAMLIDKSETINHLAKNLEESQLQCQKLMTNKDFAQESVSLKRIINALEKQSEHQQKTIEDLRTRLDSTTAELALLDSVLHENMESEFEASKRISFTKQNLVESTPLTTSDRLERLKNELYRSMATQKIKREEIKRLQNELEEKNKELEKLHCDLNDKYQELKSLQNEMNSKNNEIKYLKEEENKYLVIIDTQKEEKLRLENKIKMLENEINEIGRQEIKVSKLSLLETENSRLKSEKEVLEHEINEIRRDYKHLRTSPPKSDENRLKELDFQLKNLNIDLEELKQEHESLRNNYEAILKENEVLKEHKQIDPLSLELEKQKFLLKDAQKECDRIKNLYINISNAKELISIELEQLKTKDVYKELQEEKEKSVNLQRALQLAEMKCSEVSKLLEIEKTNRDLEVMNLKEKIVKEKSDLPKNSSHNCTKCFHYTAEITKLEISNITLENQCAVYRKEMAELREKLLQSQKIIFELNEKLNLQEDQEKIIADLKEKAQQFQEYVETCRGTNTYSNSNHGSSNSTSGISSPKTSTTQNRCETTAEYRNKLQQEIESSIRDEMAKIFAKELKAMEECFKIRIKDFEEKNNTLINNLEKLNNDLLVRQNEIKVLRYTVIAEREKFNEITKIQTVEKEKTIQKFTNILQKCREELKVKQERVMELVKELEERNIQIENERQSMKSVMNQWEDSRTLSENKEAEMIKCINEMKHEHLKIVESWRAKYESAKKTANNYKLYSEEKEQHIMKEYQRMKTEFELAKTKLKTKFHNAIENKSNKNCS